MQWVSLQEGRFYLGGNHYTMGPELWRSGADERDGEGNGGDEETMMETTVGNADGC